VAAYLNGQLEKDACLELWTRREIQYAKRQLTWWKKQDHIAWFDRSQPTWFDELFTHLKTGILKYA
jgi:tRNA A37 N6-isopentenylltransferase MiaA